MKFESIVSEIIQVVKQLIFAPKQFWQDSKEGDVDSSTNVKLFIFAVFLSGLTAFLGELIWSKAFLWYFALGLSLRVIFSYLLLWFVSGFLINKLALSYKAQLTKGVVSNVLIFSLLPAIIISFFVNLFPGLYPLNMLGLYGFYLFYQGVDSCFNLPKENLSRYVLLALVLIIFVSGLTYTLTWAVLKEVFPYGV
ncbi:MAG: Yip1 family protein [Mangrovibacterium sp.]